MTKTKIPSTKIPPVLMTAAELNKLTERLRHMASIVADIEADGGEIESDEDAQKYGAFVRVCVDECTRIEDAIGRATHDAEMCLRDFQNTYYLAQELRSSAPGAVGERLRQWETPAAVAVDQTIDSIGALVTVDREPVMTEKEAWAELFSPPPPEEEKTLTDLLPPAHLAEEEPTEPFGTVICEMVGRVADALFPPAAPDYSPFGITHVTLDMVPPAYRHPDGTLDARQASVDHFDLGLAVPGVTFAPARPAR
jgi:hypothetical protein